jgi:hypothetical protein
MEWSLDGSLPKKLPVITTSNQDGRQAKHRKKRKNLFLIEQMVSDKNIFM